MAFFPHEFIFHPTNNEDQDHQGEMMFLKRSTSFTKLNGRFGEEEEEDGLVNNQEDELSDECGGGGAGSGVGVGKKKKRLRREQVRELERSFEQGNKLEPERKLQLAKSLSLQPRQVAIWFQNRRARWKTKQLEKDYGLLKKQFASAVADNDKLQSQNNQLRQELQALRSRDPVREGATNIKKEVPYYRTSWSNDASEISCQMNLLDSTRTPMISMNLFPSSFNRPATMSHLLETSLRSDPQPSRINQVVPDESLCNILCSMDDQTAGMWSWAEQHHFGQ